MGDLQDQNESCGWQRWSLQITDQNRQHPRVFEELSDFLCSSETCGSLMSVFEIKREREKHTVGTEVENGGEERGEDVLLDGG